MASICQDAVSKSGIPHLGSCHRASTSRQPEVCPCLLPMDMSRQRMDNLRKQREPQLRSVLREKDYAEFDLERAIRTVSKIAGAL